MWIPEKTVPPISDFRKNQTQVLNRDEDDAIKVVVPQFIMILGVMSPYMMFGPNWACSVFVHFGNVFYHGFECFIFDIIWFESLGIYFRV